MDKAFIVKGLNPLGRVVELRVMAASAADAKRQAEETGLELVTVTDAPDHGVRASPDAPLSAAPDAPPPATGG